MRIAFIILLGIHATIHLFGFFKAFGILEFNAISQPISRIGGLYWLLSFVLFATTLVFVLVNANYAWVSGLLAVVASQILIINYWADAKYGTVLNILILLAVIILYASYSFNNQISKERSDMFRNTIPVQQNTITENDIAGLPLIVQKWLVNSGVTGKKRVSNVYLVQDLKLKMTPEQKEWSPGTAEQYFTVHPPAFNWNIKTSMKSILAVAGRDKFENGHAAMTIKLASLIPVVDARNHLKLDQAALQRYLAEIVWFPSAAMSPQIVWEPIDSNSAKATMQVNKTKASGTFYFDNNGTFLKYTAFRYKDVEDKEPILWTVTAIKSEFKNGIKIPVELKAEWALETGKWAWLKLKIKDIHYNVEKMPVNKHD
jgi:hypothetical protein